MEWACDEKHVHGVGDPARPRRNENELEDPTCVHGALEPPGAEWGAVGVLVLRRMQDSLSFTALIGLVGPDQNLRSCFLPRSLPRTFASSNQCRGFVHWRNQGSQGSWQAAMDLGEARENGREGSSALLDLLCDLGRMVYLWESQLGVGDWCITQEWEWCRGEWGGRRSDRGAHEYTRQASVSGNSLPLILGLCREPSAHLGGREGAAVLKR